MLHRLLRAAFAVLVAVAFGCMPALTLAGPADESPPPLELVALEPDVDQVNETGGCFYTDTSPDAFTGEIAMDDRRSSTVSADPAYPLRE